MKFASTHKVISFALAAVSSYPVLFSGEVSAVFGVLFPLLFVAGWFLEPPLTRKPKYRRAVTGVVLALFVGQVGRMTTGAPMAAMGMEFALVLLAAKLLTRGFAGDYYQIVVLGFLAIIGAAVATDDLVYGACFILFVALCPPLLALSYLRQEMERRFGPAVQSDGEEILERLLRSKRVISPGFLLGSSLLSVPILLVTVVLFVVFPRIGLGFLGRVPSTKATVGFGDTVTLGDFDISLMSDDVLVRLEPIPRRVPSAEYLNIKLRGAIFDRYEDDRWTKSKADEWKPLPQEGESYTLGQRGDPGLHPGYRILLEPMKTKILLVPEETGIISTGTVLDGGETKRRLLERNQQGVIRYRDDTQVGIRYVTRLTGAPPLGDVPRRNTPYLQLPGNSERLRDLAALLAGAGSTPPTKARRIVEGLRTGYGYSLKLSKDDRNLLEDNPLDRFLFTRKTGTCEHFATALALLLRAEGIPSRLITGFSGAQWNSVGEYWAVSENFAHSWVEAYLKGRWVTLDATPASETSWGWERPSKLAMLLDSIKKTWHERVVGYDVETQAKLATAVWRALIKKYGSKNGVPQVSYKGPLLTAVLIGLGIGVIVWVVRRRRMVKSQPGTPSPRTPSRQREATRICLTLDRKLARLGYPRPKARTPNEHAELIRSRDSAFGRSVCEITERYNQLRFGRQTISPVELKQLKNQIKQLQRSA